MIFQGNSIASDLLEVYDQAVQKDMQLKIAQDQKGAASEQIPQARSALLPHVQLQGGYGWNKQYEGDKDRYSVTNYALNLSIPLFHKDRNIAYDQAKLGAEGKEYALESAEQDLMLRTANAYFNILAAQDEWVLTQAVKRAVQRQLEHVLAAFEVGNAILPDVEEAQSRFDTINANIVVIENQIETRWEELIEIIGEKPEKLADLKEDMPLQLPEGELAQWKEMAFTQSPDLESLRLMVETAEKEIDKMKAGRYPVVDLQLGHHYNDSQASIMWQGGKTETDAIMLQAAIPLYQGGRVAGQVREAHHKLAEARHNYEKAQREIARLLSDSYRGVETTIARIEALNQARKSAESSLNSTKEGFNAGARTMLDILNAEQALHVAKRDLSTTRYQYIISQLNVKRVAGVLTQTDLEEINTWLETGE